MLLQALSDGIFTQKSDVWAMGVVMWEIVMYAMSPYPALSNQEVFDFVTAGRIMEKPEICRDDLYAYNYFLYPLSLICD